MTFKAQSKSKQIPHSWAVKSDPVLITQIGRTEPTPQRRQKHDPEKDQETHGCEQNPTGFRRKRRETSRNFEKRSDRREQRRESVEEEIYIVPTAGGGAAAVAAAAVVVVAVFDREEGPGILGGVSFDGRGNGVRAAPHRS